MPVYNEHGTVGEAIRQILDTAYPVDEVELVIVDDGSSDGTREALNGHAFDKRVRVVMHERNSGKGTAVRTALEHATGTYSAIMDADLNTIPPTSRRCSSHS